MDDISLRNHVDSLRFRGDIARTKLFIKMADFIRKTRHQTVVWILEQSREVETEHPPYFSVGSCVMARGGMAEKRPTTIQSCIVV
jgi:hypothetical protein